MSRSWSHVRVILAGGRVPTGWNSTRTKLGSYGLVHRTNCPRFGFNINISTEAMCLGVLLDGALTFAPQVQRLSGKSFYDLRTMITVQKSLTEDTATTMVYAFIRVG